VNVIVSENTFKRQPIFHKRSQTSFANNNLKVSFSHRSIQKERGLSHVPTFGALMTDDSVPNLASPKHSNEQPSISANADGIKKSTEIKPKVAFGRSDVAQ
jgi:hypothetical protein